MTALLTRILRRFRRGWILALPLTSCVSTAQLHGPAVDLYVQAQTIADACEASDVLDEDTKCSVRAMQKVAEAARRFVCVVEGEECR